jgi:hypothetical protein
MQTRFQMLNRCCDRGSGLVSEEHAGLIDTVLSADGFQRGPLAKGDDGRTACLGLDRRNAEILFGREDECLCPLKIVDDDIVGLLAHQGYVRTRQTAGRRHVRPVSNDDKLSLRHLRERLNDQWNALVRHHA